MPGTAESGSLANPGDQALFTFSAMAGQRVFYNATVNSSGLYAVLEDASGDQIFLIGANSQNGPYTLPITSTYTLTIYGSGSATGAFGFNLRALAAPVTTNYVLGTAESRTLANPGDEALFTFSAMAGQRVFYNATVNSSGLYATLEDAMGDQVFVIGANGQNGPYTLPITATYTLTIYGPGDDTGAFGFNLRGRRQW